MAEKRKPPSVGFSPHVVPVPVCSKPELMAVKRVVASVRGKMAEMRGEMTELDGVVNMLERRIDEACEQFDPGGSLDPDADENRPPVRPLHVVQEPEK